VLFFPVVENLSASGRRLGCQMTSPWATSSVSTVNRISSTIDHIFCIRQILEKKWEYNEEVHQIFIDFKQAYDSVRREVLYKILIEFGIPKKLVRLMKMSLMWEVGIWTRLGWPRIETGGGRL